MTRDEVRAVVLGFPGVEEGVTFGSVSFKVNGKGLCGIGSRLDPDDIMFSRISFDEAELLMEQYPGCFHTAPHYAHAGYILARIATLDEGVLRTLVERQWRHIAKKADAKAWDARQPGEILRC